MYLGSVAVSLAVLSSLASAEAKGRDSWDLCKHLGNLTPYHKVNAPKGIHETLPGDCTVVQVMLMGRHGSRFPTLSELPYIQNLTYKLGNSSEAIKKAHLPKELQFLKKGYITSLGHDDLTAPGRRQLFDHGVNFGLKYPHLEVTSVLAGLYDRVVESAQWFAEGYFGRSWAELNNTMFSTIAEDNETISWITPQLTCPKWSSSYGSESMAKWDTLYLPEITKRLNEAVPGVNFTDAETHGALYACPYDKAAYGVSPWCDFFLENEILNFEYELDLSFDGSYGYGLPSDMGPVLGSLYVNKLIERFSNSTVDLALTGFGLARDVPCLSSTGPIDPNRKWRTSKQVMFGTQMIWEKFTCNSSFEGPQIRLVLNESPFPLTICSNMSMEYGSCAFDDFVKANAFAQNITWGDETWNATCGASDL